MKQSAIEVGTGMVYVLKADRVNDQVEGVLVEAIERGRKGACVRVVDALTGDNPRLITAGRVDYPAGTKEQWAHHMALRDARRAAQDRVDTAADELEAVWTARLPESEDRLASVSVIPERVTDLDDARVTVALRGPAEHLAGFVAALPAGTHIALIVNRVGVAEATTASRTTS